jgi:hypothetical protein
MSSPTKRGVTKIRILRATYSSTKWKGGEKVSNFLRKNLCHIKKFRAKSLQSKLKRSAPFGYFTDANLN